MKWLGRTLIKGPYLALVLSERDFHKAMSTFKVPMHERSRWIRNDHSDATAHILDHHQFGLGCVVALRVKADVSGVQVASLLVHEAVHIFQEWCSHYGERAPSAEFQAYSIQAIAQELMQSYAVQCAGGAS